MIRVLNIASVALTLLLGSSFKTARAIESPGNNNDPYNDSAGPLKKKTHRRLGEISPLLTDGTAYSFNFDDTGGESTLAASPLVLAPGSTSPFTFVTTETLILQVTDIDDPDVGTFNVTNHGITIGCSTDGLDGFSCGTQPDPCLASPVHSSFTIFLPPGNHSLSFPRPAGHPSKTGVFRLVLPVCGTVAPPTADTPNVATNSNQLQSQSTSGVTYNLVANFNGTRGRSLQEETVRAGNLRNSAHRALNGWFSCGTNTFCVKERATCAVDDNDIGTCTCNDGYDGKECEPIDECEIDFPCPGGSICVDMFPPMMFKCECKAGFTPFLPNALPDAPGVPLDYRPLACMDNDECANTNKPCHPLATCTNTVGNFECECPEGFVGNGITTCDEPTQEVATEGPPSQGGGASSQGSCSVDTDCKGTNMQCVDDECSCRPGYAQVGPNCQNEVHCDKGGFNNDCHRRATCTEEDGSPGFSCTCIEGWEDAFEGANGKSCKDIPPVTEAPPPEPITEAAVVQSGVGPHPNRPTVFPPCVNNGVVCEAGGGTNCCSGICGTNIVVVTPNP